MKTKDITTKNWQLENIPLSSDYIKQAEEEEEYWQKKLMDTLTNDTEIIEQIFGKKKT